MEILEIIKKDSKDKKDIEDDVADLSGATEGSAYSVEGEEKNEPIVDGGETDPITPDPVDRRENEDIEPTKPKVHISRNEEKQLYRQLDNGEEEIYDQADPVDRCKNEGKDFPNAKENTLNGEKSCAKEKISHSIPQ